MINRLPLAMARELFERLLPIISLIALLIILGKALFDSVHAWLSGAEIRYIVPVFEAPIAQIGKS